MSEMMSGTGLGVKVEEIEDKKETLGAGIESKESASGRDEKGRFAKGNNGGPGNPFARKVAEFRTVIVEAVSNEDMKTIVQVLVEKAKKGDVAAAKVVMSYTAGKPESAVNPDTLDLEEWKLYEQNPQPDGVPPVLFGTVPMNPLIAFARGGIWAQSEKVRDGFLEEVRVGAERDKRKAAKKEARRKEREASKEWLHPKKGNENDSPPSHRGHRECVGV